MNVLIWIGAIVAVVIAVLWLLKAGHKSSVWVTVDGQRRKVIITYAHVLGKIRHRDYCATFKGHKPGDRDGYGMTPEAAIDSLLRKMQAEAKFRGGDK
jgi:hypothetical protein